MVFGRRLRILWDFYDLDWLRLFDLRVRIKMHRHVARFITHHVVGREIDEMILYLPPLSSVVMNVGEGREGHLFPQQVGVFVGKRKSYLKSKIVEGHKKHHIGQ